MVAGSEVIGVAGLLLSSGEMSRTARKLGRSVKSFPRMSSSHVGTLRRTRSRVPVRRSVDRPSLVVAARCVVLPGADHRLRIDQRFVNGYLRMLTDWIAAVTGREWSPRMGPRSVHDGDINS